MRASIAATIAGHDNRRMKMSHNINTIAFTGSRRDVWHHLGTEMIPGASREEWLKAAGLAWHVEMRSVWAGHSPEVQMVRAEGWKACVRSDTQHVLGIASNRYQPVQPADLDEWFEQYISVDDRFQRDVMGVLKQGEIIWGTATFNGDTEVAGDKHVARLLMTTTFDGTGATINRGTMTRVVCNNTLNTALADRQKSVVRTRHNTRFNGAKVGQELATIAQGFEAYKTMGDVMAKAHLTAEQVGKLFKHVLDIPFDMPAKDVSTRKLNQFEELKTAHSQTCNETNDPLSAWTALNAVTRYVDHERSTRGGNGQPMEARFLSSQFGSGAALKEKAVAYLGEVTEDDALRSILRAPLKTSFANVA
jgi:phage/plasmid-like protein (TIGR03299 family)